MFSQLQVFQATEATKQLVEVEKNLEKLNSKIEELKSSQLKPQKVIENQEWDWSRNYKQWESWVDKDDLLQKKQTEEEKKASLLEKQAAYSHQHDHSKEREFFLLPEEQKFQHCERNRNLGNYLFHEGVFDRAAEHYRIAIAYYEYCFPEDSLSQSKLDQLRCISLCNLSFCYLRLGSYRQAVESATQAIQEATGDLVGKSYFRRGQAYRYLDEYE
jgi:hypothetical protein